MRGAVASNPAAQGPAQAGEDKQPAHFRVSLHVRDRTRQTRFTHDAAVRKPWAITFGCTVAEERQKAHNAHD